MELWIGRKEIPVNGQIKEIDLALEIINRRSYFPISSIIENIYGYDIEWNKEIRINN